MMWSINLMVLNTDPMILNKDLMMLNIGLIYIEYWPNDIECHTLCLRDILVCKTYPKFLELGAIWAKKLYLIVFENKLDAH